MSYLVSLTRNPNLSAPKVDRSTSNEVLAYFKNNWWTGKSPEQCKGFDAKEQTLKALPLLNLAIASRQDILDYFDNSWTLTELLFSSLKQESAYTRSPYHQLRHPLIFYYGHPAVLYYNKMRLAGVFKEPVDLYLEKILETGVDEMSWDDMSKNDMSWPTVETVHAYRKKIYNLVKDIILTHPDLEDPQAYVQKRGPKSTLWSLFMGMEHEKIHFETSSVLIRELPIELVETPKYWPKLHESKNKAHIAKPEINTHFPTNTWISQPASTVSWGKPETAVSYGWDNEYGQRQKQISAFEVTSNLISNGEYYEFVASLAYSDDKYWSQEGLQWRKFRNTKRPTFWVAYGPEGLHDYKLRTIFEIIDMPWDWPAEVNFHEAQAYCRWKQEQDKSNLVYRLITEPEHVALRDREDDAVLQVSPFDYSVPSLPYNFNFHYSSANPVDYFKPNSKGVRDLFGNVWQWAEDQFNPLENFKVNPLYDDFSTPCFDGKHQMILGGSFISCGHEASKWARFHFRPHFFQHAGFRIARTLDGSSDNGATRLLQTNTYIHPKRLNVLEQMQTPQWWKQQFIQPLEVPASELEDVWKSTQTKILNFERDFTKRAPMGTALDPKTNDVPKSFRVPYQTVKQFPNRGEDFNKLLNLIFDELAPLGQQPGHPGYMAYVAGAGNAISNIAQSIAQTLNQYTAHFNMAPGLVTLENEALNWFKDLLGFHHAEAGACFTTGGSMANLQALAAARNAKLKDTDLAKARFYANEQVHHCVGKALAFLGFPKESLVFAKCQNNFQIDLLDLESKIQADLKKGLTPIALIGTAGSTNTGTIDDLKGMAQLAQKFSLWYHVDGAYGAVFMLTEKGKKLLAGIESADSVALDPHKGLSIPYGTGCLIVKNKLTLRSDYSGLDTYMPPSAGFNAEDEMRLDFADISPELSRDFRGLKVWLPIKFLGIQPFTLNLEEKLELAQHLKSELNNLHQIEVVKDPELTILTFKHKQSEKTRDLLTAINKKGKVFLSGCEILIHGQKTFVIRVCMLGFRNHIQNISDLLNDLKESLKEI